MCVIMVDSCATLVFVLFDDGLTMDRMFESTSFETCDWGGGIVTCVDVLMLCAFGT